MKRAVQLLLILGLLTTCRTKITPLMPPADPSTVTTCKAPPIEKNIVGTWRFESNYNNNRKVTSGTVTFDARSNIIDPDSLFQNYLDTGPVVAKTYESEIITSNYPTYSGKLFEVYLKIKNGNKQINHLVVMTNECKKVVMASLGDYNKPNKTGFTLTR